jgi:hypothetical protein
MSPDSSSDSAPGSDDALKNIFGYLEKNFPSEAGDSAVPEELRRLMKEFAEGKTPSAEIEALCTQILRTPESIRAFAQILGGS